jgi:hypothetical protein
MFVTPLKTVTPESTRGDLGTGEGDNAVCGTGQQKNVFAWRRGIVLPPPRPIGGMAGALARRGEQ